MGARIDVVAVVVVSLCSAGDLLRGRIGWFWRAHSHARGGFVFDDMSTGKPPRAR